MMDDRGGHSPMNGAPFDLDETEESAVAPSPRARRAGAATRPRGAREPEIDDGRTIVRVVAGRPAEAADTVEMALLAADVPIYARSKHLVRPVMDAVDTGRGRRTTVARFREMCPASLMDDVSRVVRFQRFDARANDFVNINPPNEVLAILLSRDGKWALPPVAGPITTPTIRPDGSILSAPGYDPATRLYLTLDPDFRMPPIPDHPTRADAERALALLDDLLSGFPFKTPNDRAVALSGILTAVLRGTIPAAPLHAIKAHSAGTGKSCLVDIAATISTGRACAPIALGKTEEETEKRLDALLLSGQAFISIDNVNGQLGGNRLCQITSQTLVGARPLGKSEIVTVECRAVVFANGNNMTVTEDMVRRSLICAMDAGIENPEVRRFAFNPIERVNADRGAYVAAVLTIAKAYRCGGQAPECVPYAGYDEWAAAVRKPLLWLGVADPVASIETGRSEDPGRAILREMHDHLAARMPNGTGYGASDIIKRAEEQVPSSNGYGMEHRFPEFHDLLMQIAGNGSKVNSATLGIWLKEKVGVIIDERRIEVIPDKKNGNKYFVRVIKPETDASAEREEKG